MDISKINAIFHSHFFNLIFCTTKALPLRRARPAELQAVLPADASAEDVDVDAALPFLDGFVARALQNGAAPYIPGAPKTSSDSRTQNTEGSSVITSSPVTHFFTCNFGIFYSLVEYAEKQAC